MTVRNRGGFTLVELLVVVTIIGMLVALLVPAVIAARNAARRAECFNNQSELSKAIQQFEMAKQHFPGYNNNFGEQWNGNTFVRAQVRDLSWMVVCLPYLGREDLWRQWRDNLGAGAVHVDQFICGADEPPEDHATSYVANCGVSGGVDGPAYGVFHDHRNYSPQQRTLVSASNMPDGAQSTLLISENVSATQWGATTETAIGMVWRDSAGTCGLINGCLDDPSRAGSPDELVRPSSRHSGGVVASFCDGHQYFLREDIDYRVYQHLMTPDSRAANLSGTLSEGDY